MTQHHDLAIESNKRDISELSQILNAHRSKVSKLRAEKEVLKEKLKQASIQTVQLDEEYNKVDSL